MVLARALTAGACKAAAGHPGRRDETAHKPRHGPQPIHRVAWGQGFVKPGHREDSSAKGSFSKVPPACSVGPVSGRSGGRSGASTNHRAQRSTRTAVWPRRQFSLFRTDGNNAKELASAMTSAPVPQPTRRRRDSDAASDMPTEGDADDQLSQSEPCTVQASCRDGLTSAEGFPLPEHLMAALNVETNDRSSGNEGRPISEADQGLGVRFGRRLRHASGASGAGALNGSEAEATSTSQKPASSLRDFYASQRNLNLSGTGAASTSASTSPGHWAPSLEAPYASSLGASLKEAAEAPEVAGKVSGTARSALGAVHRKVWHHWQSAWTGGKSVAGPSVQEASKSRNRSLDTLQVWQHWRSAWTGGKSSAGLGLDLSGAVHLDDVNHAEEDGGPFRLKLDNFQATLLLNFLAFGYAATAVLVKMMAGERGADVAGLQQGVTAISTSTGGILASCMCVATSAEFTVRFVSAAAASGLLLWASRWKRGSSSTNGAAAKKDNPGSLLIAGMDLGFWMFVTYAGQSIGLQSTSAHDAALILTSAVVMVPFLEALDGAKLHWNVWMATAMAGCGLVLLEGGGAAPSVAQAAELISTQASILDATPALLTMAPQAGGHFIPQGHLWCFLGALGSAVHVVRSEKQCANHGPLELVTIQLATTAVLGMLWLGWSLTGTPEADPSLATPSTLAAAFAAVPLGMALLSGPLGTGICEWAELEALQFVKASTATLILTASPLWSSLIAFLALGETMTQATVIGASMILASSLQVQLLGKGHTPSASDAES